MFYNNKMIAIIVYIAGFSLTYYVQQVDKNLNPIIFVKN